MSSLPVTADDVRAAASRILPYVVATPLLHCGWLSERTGIDVLVKWESQQRTGSFKWRGALSKLTWLRERGAREVLAVSAGNHGLGVAEAARLLGMRATVVVPQSAVANKVAAIRRAGAELVIEGADYDAAEAAARALAERRGVDFVSPYNDVEVIAGQGTVALEMLGQGRFETLMVPTGGGGLIAGSALAARDHAMAPRVIGTQPVHAPAMHEALARGGVIGPIEEKPTIADGLAGNIEVGAITVPIVAALVDHIALVSEESIGRAIRGFVEFEHQIVEGSGAVAAAAILEHGAPVPGPVAIIVSGRNIDLARLRAILH